jgi:pimeloyl-ACP methyl ester carboxylesterase
MLQLAGAMGERSTIAQYPDLIDLMVALRRDPINERAAKAEFRALLSPFALLSRSGFRRGRRLRTDELGSIAVPTLLIWGERDPLGDRSVAIRLAERIPGAQLKLMGTGHGPWLGQPQETAKAITEFVR